MAAVQLPHFSMQVCDVRFSAVTLVGNEGMKPFMVMMGIHSLIPYEGPAS